MVYALAFDLIVSFTQFTTSDPIGKDILANGCSAFGANTLANVPFSVSLTIAVNAPGLVMIVTIVLFGI